MESSEYLKKNGIYDLVVFSLEQALRLFLESRIMAQGAEYPRTHSVRVLVEIFFAVVPENKKPVIKGILDDYHMELGVLEDVYITSRYVSRDFTKSEADRLTRTVAETIKLVKLNLDRKSVAKAGDIQESPKISRNTQDYSPKA